MSFDVTASAYGRFMGRFSEPLAAEFADLLGARAGDRALDVGCGPGALTAQLVRHLGAGAVSAVDPSVTFVSEARKRFPEVEVREAPAEDLPFDDDSFDLAAAQLVVHFMADPVAGLAEMARVTRPGGLVAACVWDHAGGGGPLSTFWQAVRDTDPTAAGEAELAGAREGQLAELFEAAGLQDVTAGSIGVEVAFSDVEDWWAPFTLGVGPAGAYLAGIDATATALLRARCTELLPAPPFTVHASAWSATGRA